jgi:hypothetical protein
MADPRDIDTPAPTAADPEEPSRTGMGERGPRTSPGAGLDDQTAIAAVKDLFDTHEVRVLGAVGLLIGYICVFFAKIMYFTQMYVGICAVIVITSLLLLLNKEVNFTSRLWWTRSITVIILSVFFTSPQLYDAWTVSVAEAKLAALGAQEAAVHHAQQPTVSPTVTINNLNPAASQ